MVEDYAAQYETLFDAQKVLVIEKEQSVESAVAIYKGALECGVLSCGLPGDNSSLLDRLHFAEYRLNSIENSKSFKALLVVKKILSPYKKVVWPILKKAANILKIKG